MAVFPMNFSTNQFLFGIILLRPPLFITLLLSGLFMLINIAALYFYLDYEFIAAVQIVVYVGGIVVLILFALFLTHQAADDLPSVPVGRMFFSLLACLFGLGFAYALLLAHQFPETGNAPVKLTVAYLGKQMLNYGTGGFVLPFEVVSILLLAAMVGCIAIALRTRKKNEQTNS